MDDPTKFLVIIPARGGSKRIPGKNIRPLNNIPLINWTIGIALNYVSRESVLVSTDDEQIAAISHLAGAFVPWVRPSELATDLASSIDVVSHALAWYEEEYGLIDAVILLQPTSPLRHIDTIKRAVKAFKAQPENDLHSLISLSPVNQNPAWCFALSNGKLKPIINWDAVSQRSQDLQKAYIPNGSIYIAPAVNIRNRLPFIEKGAVGFLMEEPFESIDIDTEEDWKMAEFYLETYSGKSLYVPQNKS